ncbi:hypothetical protein BKA93DRAFT_812545, partial [Sparassis latifolia]
MRSVAFCMRSRVAYSTLYVVYSYLYAAYSHPGSPPTPRSPGHLVTRSPLTPRTPGHPVTLDTSNTSG